MAAGPALPDRAGPLSACAPGSTGRPGRPGVRRPGRSRRAAGPVGTHTSEPVICAPAASRATSPEPANADGRSSTDPPTRADRSLIAPSAVNCWSRSTSPPTLIPSPTSGSLLIRDVEVQAGAGRE